MEVVVAEAETDVDGTCDDAEEEARDAVVLGERFVFSTVICERKVSVDCCSDDVWIVTSSLKRLKCGERSNLSTTKKNKNKYFRNENILQSVHNFYSIRAKQQQ